MPTYEYQCKKCHKKFDLVQRMSDSPIKKCKLCKTGSVERLIGSGGGLIFKGSGFYETDYKRATKQSDSTKSTPPPKKND